MKVRWLVLVLAGLVMVSAWVTFAIAYSFFEPSIALWTALVTAAALSVKAFFWVSAGVLGWSFLAGRREMPLRLRRRFFGGRG